MKSRTLLIGGLLLVGLVALLVVAILAFLLLVRSVTRQVASEAGLLTITLTTPSNGARVPLDTFTSVQAEASGVRPIASLELWVDGVPVEAKSPPAGTSVQDFSAFWTWTPAAEGDHTLVVRAVDTKQNMGTSNAVRVTASHDASAAIALNYQAGPTDTLQTVADKFHAVPQQIIDLNPQANPNGPLTQGQAISVPIPGPPPPPGPTSQPPPDIPTGPTQPVNNLPPNAGGSWIGNVIHKFSPTSPPAAPQVAAKADMCNAKLFLYDKSNNESGFFVYRLAGNESSFQRVATLDANSGTEPLEYTDPALHGQVEYYISAFNWTGESPSNIASVNITDPACLTSEWQGIQFQNALITTNQPVDKVYGYLSFNSGPWSRVPPTPNTFIYPTNGVFDISQYLNTLVPKTAQGNLVLDLECWGWKGNNLMYLGEAKQTLSSIQAPNLPVTIVGPQFQLSGNLVPLGWPPAPTAAPTPGEYIAPPYNLRTTTDPADAAAHLGSQNPNTVQGFAEVMQKGIPILVWEWDPGAYKNEGIRGFNVYRTDAKGGSHDLMTSVQQPDSRAVSDISWSAGQCLVVRAYKEYHVLTESADSNVVCPEGYYAMTQAFAATKLGERNHHIEDSCSSLSYIGHGGEAFLTPADEILAGFDWIHDDPATGCSDLENFYQGAVSFGDPVGQHVPAFSFNSLAHKTVFKATLRYRSDEDYFEAGTAVQGSYCATRVGLATQDFEPWAGYDWAGGHSPVFAQEPYLDLHAIPVGSVDSDGHIAWTVKGNAFTVDVTSALKNWFKGDQPRYYGFVFTGAYPFGFDGPPDSGLENACWSKLSQFELDVNYK